MKRDLEPLLPLDDSPLRALAGAIPVENPTHVEARRSALTAAIGDEIERERGRALGRRRSQRRLAFASAAALLLVGSLALFETRGALWGREAGERALVVGASGTPHTLTRPATRLEKGAILAPGQIVVTEEATRLSLELGGRTSLELREDAELELSKLAVLDQSFFLRRGAVHIDVPHPEGLGARSVRVKTPEALVSVKGTRFGVEVKTAGEPPVEYTRVWVERGSVEVREGGRIRLLAAGESWRSDANSDGPAAMLRSSNASASGKARPEGPVVVAEEPRESDSSAGKREDKRAGAQRATGGTSIESRSPADASTTLAAENRLFEEALAAERSGNFRRAEDQLLELLARYPNSPLRAAARAELGRLHARE